MKRVFGCIAALVCFQAIPSFAADGLKEGDHVAIIGDSITEQKLYSVFMEDYLLMCKPVAGIKTTQFGWGGETSWGFFGRLENDLAPFKPTVATTCYGMNDGGYSPMNEGKAKQYRDAQKNIVENLKKKGLHLIVLGSPGVVDADTFHNKNTEAALMYNKTLGALRDIDKELAQEEGVVFGDTYGAMMDVMTKAKAKYGKEYVLAGGDGVHPGPNGHLCMAYAYLKALGCDGNIGTITVDVLANKAEATEGHKVLSANNGSVEIESTRYPFCFFGADPKSQDSTRGVLEFLPFNQDLNRLMLIVKNPGGDKVTVTWGKASKEFPAADLAKGINLAAEFLDSPFAEQFTKVESVIKGQQNYETRAVKELIHNLSAYREFAPTEKESLDRIAAGLVKHDEEMEAASTAAITPVKHTIKIEVAK